jgi:lipoprotein-anchoring transpeptidase ErfK/SrfK
MYQERVRRGRAGCINQTVEGAPVLVAPGRPNKRFGREMMKSAVAMMRRTSVASLIPVCAAVILIASSGGAASQGLDPGWQLAYPGQPGGGGGGLLQSMLGDGTGLPVVGRAYQPAPMYYDAAPSPQPRPYRGGVVYYRPVQGAPLQVQQVQQAPAARAPLFQPPQLYYYRQVAAPPLRSYQQQAPAYTQQVPPQTAPAPAAPGFRGEAVAPPAGARAQYVAPLYAAPPYAASQYAPVPAPQPRGFAAPVSYPAAAAAANRPAPAPVGSANSSPPQASYQAPPASATTQTSAAPPRGLFQWFQSPQPAQQPPPPAQAAQPQQRLAFGFGIAPPQGYDYEQPGYAQPGYMQPSSGAIYGRPQVDPKYDRQLVDYAGNEPPGTIIIDTPNFFLYLVLDGGKAIRYGIGVGRPGFTWAGVKTISAMREWPDWYPPTEMLARRPDLPRYMPGGPDNPLGARALYLGSTLYRIHGSNEPWSIGTQVSSGCIRLRNADVIDLYSRVKLGAKVVVI